MLRIARRVLLLASCAAALAAPQAALAGLAGAYKDYSSDGSLEACKYSAAELEQLLGSVPTDIAQYDPRFVDELNRAADTRSSGACHKQRSLAKAAPAAAATSGKGGGGKKNGAGAKARDGSPAPPGPALAATSTEVPLSAAADFSSDRGFPIALGVLASILAFALLGAAGWTVARRHGWNPSEFFQGLREGSSR